MAKKKETLIFYFRVVGTRVCSTQVCFAFVCSLSTSQFSISAKLWIKTLCNLLNEKKRESKILIDGFRTTFVPDPIKSIVPFYLFKFIFPFFYLLGIPAFCVFQCVLLTYYFLQTFREQPNLSKGGRAFIPTCLYIPDFQNVSFRFIWTMFFCRRKKPCYFTAGFKNSSNSFKKHNAILYCKPQFQKINP